MWVCVEAGAKFCCVPVSLCAREIMKADSQVQHSSLCPAGSGEPQEHGGAVGKTPLGSILVFLNRAAWTGGLIFQLLLTVPLLAVVSLFLE